MPKPISLVLSVLLMGLLVNHAQAKDYGRLSRKVYAHWTCVNYITIGEIRNQNKRVEYHFYQGHQVVKEIINDLRDNKLTKKQINGELFYSYQRWMGPSAEFGTGIMWQDILSRTFEKTYREAKRKRPLDFNSRSMGRLRKQKSRKRR